MKTFVLGLVVVAGIMSSCSPKAKEETTLSGLNPKKFHAEIDGKRGMESNALKRENGCNSSGCSKKNFFVLSYRSLWYFIRPMNPYGKGYRPQGRP